MKFVVFTLLAFLLGACSSDAGEGASENCQIYCADAKANCVGKNALYDNDEDCFATCSILKDRAAEEGRVAGNTLQCRIYHVDVAASNPATHCPHASLMSTIDTCQDVVTVCDKYCTEYFESCKSEFNADFGELNDCLNNCPGTIPLEGTAKANDTEDTANCRLSQAVAKNCAGAQIVSAVCVDPLP